MAVPGGGERDESAEGALRIEPARMEKRVALLRSMPLFAELRQSDLELLLGDLRLREYARDELIFHQGDESRQVYFVLKGKLRVYKISAAGDETSIDILGENEIVGELAALDNRPRSATAKAVTPVSLLTMTQEAFVARLNAMPGLAVGLARVLAQKLRWTAAYAEAVAQYDAAGRLLHIILVNNDRYGIDAGGGRRRVPMGLNQTDLASMIGARREWVNRILSDWRKRGLLEFDNGEITILDVARVSAERDSRLEANTSGETW